MDKMENKGINKFSTPKSIEIVSLHTSTKQPVMHTVLTKNTNSSSNSFLKIQAVYSSETLLPRPHVILTTVKT
jgi:tRNA A37 threonylcarbamoyladenosine dehydratase